MSPHRLFLPGMLTLLLCSCGEKSPQDPVAASPKTPLHEIPASSPALEKGRQIWLGTCMVCHLPGLAGAPKIGDKVAWAPRIAKGESVLFKHAIEGWDSPVGNTMPPKGGNPKLSDEDVQQAVRYVISVSQ